MKQYTVYKTTVEVQKVLAKTKDEAIQQAQGPRQYQWETERKVTVYGAHEHE